MSLGKEEGRSTCYPGGGAPAGRSALRSPTQSFMHPLINSINSYSSFIFHFSHYSISFIKNQSFKYLPICFLLYLILFVIHHKMSWTYMIIYITSSIYEFIILLTRGFLPFLVVTYYQLTLEIFYYPPPILVFIYGIGIN